MVPMMWPHELARFPASNKIAELNKGSAISQSKFSDVCILYLFNKLASSTDAERLER